MPSGVSDFGVQTWLSTLFGVTADITGYWIALCSDQPGVGFDGTILSELEPTDSAYARQSYGVGGTNWGVNGNHLTNLLQVDFGTPVFDWGLVSHYALVSAASGGELYAWGEFLGSQLLVAGYDVVVPPGGIVISFASQDNSIAI